MIGCPRAILRVRRQFSGDHGSDKKHRADYATAHHLTQRRRDGVGGVAVREGICNAGPMATGTPRPFPVIPVPLAGFHPVEIQASPNA